MESATEMVLERKTPDEETTSPTKKPTVESDRAIAAGATPPPSLPSIKVMLKKKAPPAERIVISDGPGGLQEAVVDKDQHCGDNPEDGMFCCCS